MPRREPQSPLRSRPSATPSAAAAEAKQRPALNGLTGSHPATKVLKFTIKVAADGSGYGLALANRGNYAFVERLLGEAQAAGSLQVHDRITNDVSLCGDVANDVASALGLKSKNMTLGRKVVTLALDQVEKVQHVREGEDPFCEAATQYGTISRELLKVSL